MAEKKTKKSAPKKDEFITDPDGTVRKKGSARPKKTLEQKIKVEEDTPLENILFEKIEDVDKTGQETEKPLADVTIISTPDEEIAKDMADHVDAEITQQVSALGDSSQKKQLSQQAMGWKKFLERQRMTPEQWLEKYPTNKFKHFVEEIVEFEKNSKNDSI